MSPTTTDPNDPRLGHGVDSELTSQNEVYLVLSEEDRAKGFMRPLRLSYKHVGKAAPTNPLRDLTNDEQQRHAGEGYVKFEVYPATELPKTGKYWTQAELDSIDKGCGMITTMNRAIAETWARDVNFYGATFCAGCMKHLPVEEFVWVDDGQRLGS